MNSWPKMPLLEDLYQQMYELTHNHCGCEGTGQYGCGCCATFHCLKAQEFARNHYDIELQSTGHPVMFMGEHGCIVNPHLRPHCTLHACCISWGPGRFPCDPGRTMQYFDLRKRIETLAKTEGKWPIA